MAAKVAPNLKPVPKSIPERRKSISYNDEAVEAENVGGIPLVLSTIPKTSIEGIRGGCDTGDGGSKENIPVTSKSDKGLNSVEDHVINVNEGGVTSVCNTDKADDIVDETAKRSDCKKDKVPVMGVTDTGGHGGIHSTRSSSSKADDLVDETAKRSDCKKDKGKTMNSGKKLGACCNDDLRQRRRFLEIEEEKLALKKRKIEILQESVSCQRRTAEAVEAILLIMREKELNDMLSNNILEC